MNLPIRRRAMLPPRVSPNQGEPAPDPGRRPRPKKRLRAKTRRQLPSRKLSLSKKQFLNRLLLPIKRLHRSKRIPRTKNRLLLKGRKSKSPPNPRMLLTLPKKRVPANVKSATTTRAVVSANPVNRGAAIARRVIATTVRRTIVITTAVASTSKTVVSQLLLRFPRKISRNSRLLSFAKRLRSWRSTSRALRRQSLSKQCLLPA